MIEAPDSSADRQNVVQLLQQTLQEVDPSGLPSVIAQATLAMFTPFMTRAGEPQASDDDKRKAVALAEALVASAHEDDEAEEDAGGEFGELPARDDPNAYGKKPMYGPDAKTAAFCERLLVKTHYHRFSKQFKKHGVTEADYLKGFKASGMSASEWTGVKPQHPKLHKSFSEGGSDAVTSYYDAHAADFQRLGTTRKGFLDAFRLSGLTAAEFLP